METRILKSGDLESFLTFERLIRKTEADIWSDPLDEMAIKRAFKEMDLNKNMIMGLFEDKQMLGRCDVIFQKSMMDFKTTAYVDWIYIEKNHRASGLGKKLMRAAIKEAKHYKATEVYLLTASNAEAMKFYDSLSELTIENKQVASMTL